MKNWAKQLAGALLVLAFALAIGGFVMVLRAQQGGLAATMAAEPAGWRHQRPGGRRDPR